MFQLVGSQCLLVPVVIDSSDAGLHTSLWELHGISLCPLLQNVEVIKQLSWAPLPSRAISFGIPPSRSLKMLKCDLLKSRFLLLLFNLFPPCRVFHHLMITAAKVRDLHILDKTLFIGTSPNGRVYL